MQACVRDLHMREGGEQVRPPFWDQAGQVDGAGLDHHGAIQCVCGQLPLLVGQGRVDRIGRQEARGSLQQRLGIGLAGSDRQHADWKFPSGDVTADLRILRGIGLKPPAELSQHRLGIVEVNHDAAAGARWTGTVRRTCWWPVACARRSARAEWRCGSL